MIKITIIVKNLASGGAEKQAVLLANALATRYSTHLIVWNGVKVHDRYLEMLADSPVEVHCVTGSYFARLFAVKKLVSKIRPQVIFSSLTAANFFASILGVMYKIPVVTSLRCTWFPKHKLVAERFTTNRLATLTVANSNTGKEVFIAAGFKPEKMEFIPNCFEKIDPPVERRESDVVRVISVGRFVPEKDYNTAIKAIAKAVAANKSIRYDIVGYGALEAEVRQAVKDAGIEDYVRILINPNNIPELLRQADIYLSTSISEGTSNAILEAMNANLPIVATNVGDNKCMVQQGDNGFLHSSGDVESIAKSICTLASDYPMRCRMGVVSKLVLSQNYSADMFETHYINLIEKLI